jgi:hypothetical protein
MRFSYKGRRRFKKYIQKLANRNTECVTPRKKQIPISHKRWVHKRFYVRRKLSKTEQLVIEFLMRAAHRRFSPAAFYNRTICLEQFVLFGMQQGKSYINSVNRYLRYNEFFSSIVKQIYDTSVASCDCGLFRGNCFIGQKCLHCKTEVIAR